MAEYINLDTAICIVDYAKNDPSYNKNPKMADTFSAYNEGWRNACNYITGILEAAPTPDMVEVVRCKECKCSGMYDFGFGDKEELACLEIEEDGFVRFATAVDPDGFCYRGKRKEGADNG